MGRKRTVEVRLNLSPKEFARLEELASFEGESPEGIIRLSLQYHWNGYQRALAEVEDHVPGHGVGTPTFGKVRA